MFIQLYAIDVDRHTSTMQSVDRHSLLKTDRMSISLTCRSTKKYCTKHVDAISRLIARHVDRHVVGSVDAPLHTCVLRCATPKSSLFVRLPRLIIIIRLILLAALAPSTEPPVDLATKCETSSCHLPYCFCSRDGTRIPGDLDPEEVCTEHWPSVFLVLPSPNLMYVVSAHSSVHTFK